ncbi:N-formimino-L-glutamate deiminase [compost metagenome]
MQGGAQASGRPIGGLAVGQQADFAVLDPAHIALAGLPVESLLSAHVFGSHRTSALRDLWVGGVQRVAAGRHALHDSAAAAFAQARAATIAPQ